jgi:hypothetical protein
VNPGVVKKKLDPEVVEHIQGILDIIEEKEEVYDDYKKKPEVVEVIEEIIEEEKIEVMEVGDPPGQSDNGLVEPVEEPNEEDTISTDTVIPTGPTDK